MSTFGVLDNLTAPDVAVEADNMCPISEWACRHHEPLSCGGSSAGDGDDDNALADGGASSDAGGGGPPVMVIDEQVVGDFQTVTFTASQAAAATQWLRDNGFIVNQTTAIYMEPYVQANMVFVAIKLVPGAGVRAIKPLRLRYRSAFPMIPLVLTAVAAEPHLTVTSFIYSDQPFRPMGHPVVAIDEKRIANDLGGRQNYPMVLARTIDEAGGDGFAVEYRGSSVRPDFGQSNSCCNGGGSDFCGLGGNSLCECPRDEFDAGDCSQLGDLVEGIALADDLANRHSTLTRLTTRVSAEEMQFDPQFEAELGAPREGRLVLRGRQTTLDGCTDRVIDKERFAEVNSLQGCAAMYCGAGGQCVTTPAGAACACHAGFVAQRFTDLDSIASVTCIPEVPPVDLRAGGAQLPDACAGIDCGMGECRDRNGVAVCDCDNGAAAIPSAGKTPRCEPIAELTATPGAEDYSDPLKDLAVCAPLPPACGEGGWLVHKASPRPGVECGDSTPGLHLLIEPPAGECEGFLGCGGCQESGDSSPVAGFAVVGLAGLLAMRRRRRVRR